MKMRTKIFALLMALIMSVSLLSGLAFAAAGSTIDTSRTGSLTVHKYAENDFLDSAGYLTQEEMARYVAGLGDAVTPLPDVTFYYLRVGGYRQYTKTETVDGVRTNVTKLGYSVSSSMADLLGLSKNDVDVTIGGVNYYDLSVLDKALNGVSATSVERYIAGQSGSVAMSATDANGATSASGLQLGLYLLCEYSYPANVVGNEQHAHSVPCLIPIPLTDYASDGSNAWVYDINVYPKNLVEDVTVDKVIVGNDNNETKEWDTEIGSHVEFVIRSDVPHGVGKINTYTVNDTLSAGLDFDVDSDTVFGVAADGMRTELTNGKDFTFSASGTHEMTWAFVPSGLANGEGWAIYDSIEIRYTATLNKDAIVGGEGNPNDVELLVSHVTNSQASADRYIPTELPRVYTYAVDLTKYGDSDSENPLEDVTFELQDKDGGVIHVSELTPGDKGRYYLDPNGTATLTTAADGHVYIKGLQAGTYYLVETSTNTGYSLLAEKIEINIYSNENTYEPSDTGTYAPVYAGERYYTDDSFGDTAEGGTVVDVKNFFTVPSISADEPDTPVPDGTYVNFNTSNVRLYPSGEKVQMYKANKLNWASNFAMGESRDEADTGVVRIIVNDQVIFELPHTGSTGKICAILIGAFSMTGAALLAIAFYKRKTAAAQ